MVLRVCVGFDSRRRVHTIHAHLLSGMMDPCLLLTAQDYGSRSGS